MRVFLTAFAALVALGTGAVAQTATSSTDNLNIDPPQPESTACGVIVEQNLYHGYSWFEAALVKECLTSVPFNSAVATRFLAWYNQTLEFYSLPAFLKNPPASYQQPAVDFFGRLSQIEDRITANYYRNQYAFEADVYSLIRDSHDNHLELAAGALSQFQFGASFPCRLMGDRRPNFTFGVSPGYCPATFSTTTMLTSADNIKHYTATGVVPSPIDTINGMPAAEYVEQAAAHQVFGNVERQADWNQMMRTPAQQIMGYTSVFSADSTFYPPRDNITAIYKNGTNYTVPYLAQYDSPGFVGPLATGGDFYNLFVLGNLPANFNETYAAYEASMNSSSGSNASLTRRDDNVMTNWGSVSSAYPNDTIAYQDDLGVASSGYVTGYFLEDISTAVISIPSFDIYGNDSTSFGRALQSFVDAATQRNATKLIIDLQQNLGGQESLVFEAVRQFFPSITPETPSRMRSHPLGNYLGQTMTSYFQTIDESDEDYDTLVSEEWMITDRLYNSTGQNFSSWQEFYGPLHYQGDTFSRIEEYNLSSAIFDYDALDFNYTSGPSKDPWSAENVVLLTDGVCSSSCSLFVRIATRQFGARTVVVGGPPSPGPMQAASGARGALSYYSDDLDYEFAFADEITQYNNLTTPLVDQRLNDTGMFISYATINLRDQIDPAEGGVPDQMLYLPADCRIYWTLANFDNYSVLWHDVWNATYVDPTLCVPGSRNASAPASNHTNDLVRKFLFWSTSDSRDRGDQRHSPISLPGSPPSHSNGFHDGKGSVVSAPQLQYCKTDVDCQVDSVCRQTTVSCNVACPRGKACQTDNQKASVCAKKQTVGTSCAGTPELIPAESGKGASVYNQPGLEGTVLQFQYCIPNSGSTRPSCSSLPR